MRLTFAIDIPDADFNKMLKESGMDLGDFRNNLEQMAYEVVSEAPGAKISLTIEDDATVQALGSVQRSAISVSDDQEPDEMSPEARASMEEARKEWKPGGPGKITLVEKVEELKGGQWWLWSAEMELPGGRVIEGEVQAGDNCGQEGIARETWRPN